MPTEGRQRMWKKVKPYAAMGFLQLGYACSNIISTATLKHGMNHFVLVVYRNAFAAAVFAPLAFFLERKRGAKLTWPIFLKIVGLAILEMETLKFRQRHSLAKVTGAVVTFVGAILMIFYTGPIVNFIWSKGRAHHGGQDIDFHSQESSNLLMGSLVLFTSTMGWSSFLILQSKTLDSYPIELSLSFWISSMGVVLNVIIALAMEHRSLKAWAIGWDMRLLTAVYTGIICSGVPYYLQGMVMNERGPVFVTAFNPLSMIITSIMGSFILSEEITVGRILGAIIIMVGVYLLIWGKSNEHQISSNKNKRENREQVEQLEIQPHEVKLELTNDDTFRDFSITKVP